MNEQKDFYQLFIKPNTLNYDTYYTDLYYGESREVSGDFTAALDQALLLLGYVNSPDDESMFIFDSLNKAEIFLKKICENLTKILFKTEEPYKDIIIASGCDISREDLLTKIGEDALNELFKKLGVKEEEIKHLSRLIRPHNPMKVPTSEGHFPNLIDIITYKHSLTDKYSVVITYLPDDNYHEVEYSPYVNVKFQIYRTNDDDFVISNGKKYINNELKFHQSEEYTLDIFRNCFIDLFSIKKFNIIINP